MSGPRSVALYDILQNRVFVIRIKRDLFKSSKTVLVNAYLLHLRPGIRAVLDFVLFRKLVRSGYALYAVSVRQTEVLPAG